jgi:hypothetical protein
MANIWDIAISILAENLNSGLSYLITTLSCTPWLSFVYKIAQVTLQVQTTGCIKVREECWFKFDFNSYEYYESFVVRLCQILRN